jgi:hypothetical protein
LRYIMSTYKTIQHVVPGDRLAYGYRVLSTRDAGSFVELSTTDSDVEGVPVTMFCAPYGTLMPLVFPSPSVADRINPAHPAYEPAFAELRQQAYETPADPPGAKRPRSPRRKE